MENKELHQLMLDLIDAGTPCALVQVLKCDGSTPLKVGAKALVDLTGKIYGTIGGGAVEAEAQHQAVAACKEGQARVFDFTMQGMSRQDSNPTCGGAMRILIDPTLAQSRRILTLLVGAIQQRQPGIFETTIVHAQNDNDEVMYQWHPLKNPTSADAIQEVPQYMAEDNREVLRHPMLPPPHLIIAGAGHVGQALALQAVLIDFEVTILDDRPEFCTVTRFPPQINIQCKDMAQALSDTAIGPDTYIVILTRSHQFDAAVLEACIQTPAAYIGMIGSQRKIAVMRRDFVETGLASPSQFDRVCAPIGLDIGSITAAEIATSIAAQLVAVRRLGPQS